MNREDVERIISEARAKRERPYLRGADLSGADLSGADLSGANLNEADLSGTDLSGTNLSRADLFGADLSQAYLRQAYLSQADLHRADLSGADLSWADLSGASGDFSIGYFGRHHAIAAGGYISIGCERHTYAEWLKSGVEIGKANGYTEDEIARYMAWIKLVVDWLEGGE